jgi:hypothetical protein
MFSLAACALVVAACSAEDGGANGAGSEAQGTDAHGVTEDTIEIGIATVDAQDASNAVEGVGGHGDALEQGTSYTQAAQAVIAYINDHGGIAGRKVVPVFYSVDATNATTRSGRSQEQERACALWTEDHHVFAMLGWVAAANLDCAARSDTLFLADILNGGQASMSASMLEDYGDVWYAPNGVTAERRGRNLVEALSKAGWFTDDSRVGILVEDREGTRDGVDDGMLPALQDLGVEPVQIVYPDGMEAPWQNYILQLQQEGVTHVLFSQSEPNAYTVSLAQTAAEAQHYQPHWAISTDLLPRALVALGAPHAQLTNTTGIGWIPALDTTADDAPTSSTGSACAEISETSGQPYASIYCDGLFFLQFVAEQATELTPKGVREAVAELGSTYESAATLGGLTSFESDRHDGASSYRVLTFDDTCGDTGCFVYTGPETPFS